MQTPQRLPVSLTPLDAALATLLESLEAIIPCDLPLAEALGCIAAEMPGFPAVPKYDVARVDGWALRARDLVGASSYSPLALTVAPVWVEAGDPMPVNCDCVIDSDLVDGSGPMFQVSAEVLPGQGVRRAGGDVAEGNSPIAAGSRIRALDLLLAQAAAKDRLSVRRPRLCIVNVAMSGANATTPLIAASARAAGTSVIIVECGRDAASIAGAFDIHSCDLLITIGGTGVGHTDATLQALASREALLAHGIALQPGRTTAIGKLGNIPVIALPGAPDQALAGWWTLALPVLDRLSRLLLPRRTLRLPLKRKIASGVGVAEIVLLEEIDKAWMPLAIGDLSLDHIGRADAWLVISGGSEGFAADTPVDAYMLRDRS